MTPKPALKIEWPTAVVASIAIIGIVLVYLADPDGRAELLTALGVAGTALLAAMRSIYSRPEGE